MKYTLLTLLACFWGCMGMTQTTVGLELGNNRGSFQRETPVVLHQYRPESIILPSLGLRICLPLKSGLWLGAGMSWRQNEGLLDYNFTTSEPGDPGVPNATGLTLTTLEIPLFIRYDWLDEEKITLFSQLDVVGNSAISKRDETLMDAGNVETDWLMRRANPFWASLEVSTGGEWKFGERVRMGLAPVLRWNASNPFPDFYLAVKPLTFGADFHLDYVLKGKVAE